MSREKYLTLLILTGVCAILVGCGAKEPTGPDPEPFNAAIATYCEEHNYEMKVARFKSLEIEGATAKASAAMREKSGLHSLTITWHFTFELVGERWKVKSVIR